MSNAYHKAVHKLLLACFTLLIMLQALNVDAEEIKPLSLSAYKSDSYIYHHSKYTKNIADMAVLSPYLTLSALRVFHFRNGDCSMISLIKKELSQASTKKDRQELSEELNLHIKSCEIFNKATALTDEAAGYLASEVLQHREPQLWQFAAIVKGKPAFKMGLFRYAYDCNEISGEFVSIGKAYSACTITRRQDIDKTHAKEVMNKLGYE